MTNYLYYKKNYRGDIISDRDVFEKYERLAERYISSVIEPYDGNDEDISDCICAVAEQLYENGDLRGVESESADGYSVTYSESFKKHLYGILKLYLPKTMLYRGF